MSVQENKVFMDPTQPMTYLNCRMIIFLSLRQFMLAISVRIAEMLTIKLLLYAYIVCLEMYRNVQ